MNHESQQPICSNNAYVTLRGKGGTTRGQGETQSLHDKQHRMASFLSQNKWKKNNLYKNMRNWTFSSLGAYQSFLSQIAK